MNANHKNRAAFSIPSIIAVLAAIFSFKMGAFFGLILALMAIVFGFVGVFLSLSPSKRGGIFSVIGVVGGLVGVIAAIVKAVMWMTNG